MRRLIPLSLLVGLGTLSLAALLISVSNSGRFAFFAQPLPGRPEAVTALHKAAIATLEAPSFLYSDNEGTGPIEYRSPNRTSATASYADVIVIGKTAYQGLGQTNGFTTQWAKIPLTNQVNNYYGPARVTSVLREFLTLRSVTRVPSGFTAREIVPASEISPLAAGQALIYWFVKTKNGFVVQYRGTAHGILPYYAIVHNRLVPDTVKSIDLGTATYSQFGQIPAIHVPPKSKIVKMVACKNGDLTEYNGGYVCGIIGS